LFAEQILEGKPLSITDPKMTRFMMTLADAVELVMYAFKHGTNGDIFVQKAPACTIGVLAEALTKTLKRPSHPVQIIGTRHGEKLFETLLSREEMASAEDRGGYFRVPPDLRDLNYRKYVEEGEANISMAEDYNSHNTTQLDVDGMSKLLLKLDFIRDLRGGHPPRLEG
jgi:UDP-glucose 4-epimerase